MLKWCDMVLLFWFKVSQDHHTISGGEGSWPRGQYPRSVATPCSCRFGLVFGCIWAQAKIANLEMAEGIPIRDDGIFNGFDSWRAVVSGFLWHSTFMKLMSLNQETICLRVKLASIRFMLQLWIRRDLGEFLRVMRWTIFLLDIIYTISAVQKLPAEWLDFKPVLFYVRMKIPTRSEETKTNIFWRVHSLAIHV